MEYTFYYINSTNGVDGPPYKIEHEVPDGYPISHPSDVTDSEGNVIIARAITKQEYEKYWDEVEKNNIKNEKKAQKAQKEFENNRKALSESVITKLVKGQKLTQEEAEFITGNLGA